MERITRGFSLLEALISLFVLGTLITLLCHSFLGLSPKYKLRKAVWEIHSRLNYARYKALFEGQKVRVKFDTGSYTLEEYDKDNQKWIVSRKCLLEGVMLQANNSPIFHPRGTVSNLASIYISNIWGKYKITLAITGRVKVAKL
jgi:Tfp pilus assembly protein FimT